MCDCDFLPHYFIWSTEDTQQLYPNRLVRSSWCVFKSVDLVKLFQAYISFNPFLTSHSSREEQMNFAKTSPMGIKPGTSGYLLICLDDRAKLTFSSQSEWMFESLIRSRSVDSGNDPSPSLLSSVIKEFKAKIQRSRVQSPLGPIFDWLYFAFSHLSLCWQRCQPCII